MPTLLVNAPLVLRVEAPLRSDAHRWLRRAWRRLGRARPRRGPERVAKAARRLWASGSCAAASAAASAATTATATASATAASTASNAAAPASASAPSGRLGRLGVRFDERLPSALERLGEATLVRSGGTDLEQREKRAVVLRGVGVLIRLLCDKDEAAILLLRIRQHDLTASGAGIVVVRLWPLRIFAVLSQQLLWIALPLRHRDPRVHDDALRLGHRARSFLLVALGSACASPTPTPSTPPAPRRPITRRRALWLRSIELAFLLVLCLGALSHCAG